MQPVLMASRPRHARREQHDLPDGELAGRVYRLARCAGSRVDPDAWSSITAWTFSGLTGGLTVMRSFGRCA